MSDPLKAYLNKRVLVITYEGRTVCGKLVSHDSSTNMILADCEERIIRDHDDPEESSIAEQGVQMIRGDTVVLCGLVDEDLDGKIDWTKVRGKAIGSTKH